MSIKKYAVSPSARLVLVDAKGEPMTNEAGKEVAVNVYGPGSKEFARARASQNNRMMDKLKAKGKSEQTAEQTAKETAMFLAECTAGFENMEYDDTLTGDALAIAIYSDSSIGFITENVNKFIGDWANFLPTSTKS